MSQLEKLRHEADGLRKEIKERKSAPKINESCTRMISGLKDKREPDPKDNEWVVPSTTNTPCCVIS